jgi:hypothetical protein
MKRIADAYPRLPFDARRRSAVKATAFAAALALLGGRAAAGTLLARRRDRRHPEPFSHYPELAEGFYAAASRRRDAVVYVDELHQASAPPGLRAAHLTRVDEAGTPDFDDLVGKLFKRRWDWAVEHAAALRLNSNRPFATGLLWAAVRADLDRASAWRHKPCLRLYDLLAVVSSFEPGKLESLCDVAQQAPGAGGELQARLEKWADPASTWRRRMASAGTVPWHYQGMGGKSVEVLILRV